jgi:hypothetical protein
MIALRANMIVKPPLGKLLQCMLSSEVSRQRYTVQYSLTKGGTNGRQLTRVGSMKTRPTWAKELPLSAYKSFKNPKFWYRFGVTLLIIIGVAGELVGYGRLRDGTFAHALTLGLSEALLISGLLAVVVDPFLKHRIQEESAWSGIFGFLNDRAPEGLRKALQELAACEVYFPKTTWTLDFTWEDRPLGVLAIKIAVRSTGENISRKPHKLDGQLWVLPSTTGFESQYLRYAANCPEAFESIDVREVDLQPHVSILGDGSLVLDEAAICQRREIPAGKTFEIAREARMFRHENGYVPLQHSRFGEELQIALQGDALGDIEVRVIHPREKGRERSAERKRKPTKNMKPEIYGFRRITPGQVTIVSWKPHVVNLA